MKPNVYILSIFLLLFVMQNMIAQDRIIKRDGNIIECKVAEIGSEEIKYILGEFGPDLQFGILKSKVDKVIFEDGKEMIIDHLEFAMETAELNSADLFLVQRKTVGLTLKAKRFDLAGIDATPWIMVLCPALFC